MTRVFFAVLLVCAQLFAGGLQFDYVLCVHEDGSNAIELSSSRCCEGAADTATDDACCAEDTAGAKPCADGAARASGDDDCCRDIPVRLHFPTVMTDDAPSPSDVHTAATARASATTGSTLSPELGTQPASVRERVPPPPDASQISLRSVRLRC